MQNLTPTFQGYTNIPILKDRVKVSTFLYKERGKFFDSSE